MRKNTERGTMKEERGQRDPRTRLPRCNPTNSGWLTWGIIFSTFAMNFLIMGTLFNYSILFVSLQKQFESSAVLTGLVGSVSMCLSCVFTPLTSLLLCKFSYRVIILTGIVVFSAGLFTTSFATALGYTFLTYGALIGVGANLTIYSSNCLLLSWFRDKNFARVSALTITGSSCGLFAFSRLVTVLIVSYGWRTTLRILSGGILVAGVTTGMILKDHPPGDNSTKKKRAPGIAAVCSEDGLPARETWTELNALKCREEVNDKIQSGHESENSASLEEKEDTLQDDDDLRPRVKSGVEMLKHLDPWAYFSASVLASLGWTFFLVNFASFMQELGLTKDQVSLVIMLFAAGEIGGKVLVSVFGHRVPVGLLYTPGASSLLATLVLGCMAVGRTHAQMMALSIFGGLFRSGLYGTSNAVSAKLFHDYSITGAAAVSLLPNGIGPLLSAPLSGGLYDATGSYGLSLVIIAAFFVCSSACFLFIPLRRRLWPDCPFCFSSTCCCSLSETETANL